MSLNRCAEWIRYLIRYAYVAAVFGYLARHPFIPQGLFVARTTTSSFSCRCEEDYCIPENNSMSLFLRTWHALNSSSLAQGNRVDFRITPTDQICRR